MDVQPGEHSSVSPVLTLFFDCPEIQRITGCE
jgi:hypothetical protein